MPVTRDTTRLIALGADPAVVPAFVELVAEVTHDPARSRRTIEDLTAIVTALTRSIGHLTSIEPEGLLDRLLADLNDRDEADR